MSKPERVRVVDLMAHPVERARPVPSMPPNVGQLTSAERDVIRRGRQAPRTWDEVNSTKGGGRDLGPY